MTLDYSSSSILPTTFDNVWIQRSLYQELRIGESTSVFFKDAYKQFANSFALRFWFCNSGKGSKESVASINVN
jgi:hypothetical protein